MNQGQDLENEDEDEFGDFGGFEGADAVPDMPPAQAQAAASHWAVLTTGSASGRPDLLCAQNRFPPHLDPSVISGSSSQPGDLNINNRADAAPPQAQVDLFGGNFLQNGNQMNQALIAENVLDGTLNVAPAPNIIPPSSQVNGCLPDIGLGINENRLFGQAPLAPSPSPLDALPINDLPPVDAPQDDVVAAVQIAHVVPAVQDDEVHVEEEVPQEVIAVPQNAPEVPERNAVQEQLNSLLERNQALEEELISCQEELSFHQSRLRDLQVSHEAQLSDMRKAGSDAVAVVVEQYKEQTQVLIAEQQEVAQRHLMDTMREQMKAFNDMLDEQRSCQEEERVKQHRIIGEQISESVSDSQQKQEEQFDAFLLAQREKHTKALEEAVLAERADCERRLGETISAEQEQARLQMENLRLDYSQQLETVRLSHETALHTVREEEKEIAREQMSELAEGERQRRREAVQTALSEARQDMRAYVEEQRQADARVRRRHLASLEVFLESSRQQISLLLDAEKPMVGDESGATGGEERVMDRDKDS